MEITRAHLGIETQRQWSDQAIARTTPLLMALLSILVLVAVKMHEEKTDSLKITEKNANLLIYQLALAA